ncbi:MAG: hypothetical protein JNM94_02195 [Phycisphaerae bacterium]|nr:hypothetical protein [Phycisphaerae bacterium]
MLYRAVRAINAVYGLAALGFFIAAFFIAFALTVVYPIVPLLMLIASIFLLVFAVTLWRILKAIELALARRQIARGKCPVCTGELLSIETRAKERDRGLRMVCVRCDRMYAADGDEWQPDPDDEIPAREDPQRGVA